MHAAEEIYRIGFYKAIYIYIYIHIGGKELRALMELMGPRFERVERAVAKAIEVKNVMNIAIILDVEAIYSLCG